MFECVTQRGLEKAHTKQLIKGISLNYAIYITSSTRFTHMTPPLSLTHTHKYTLTNRRTHTQSLFILSEQKVRSLVQRNQQQQQEEAMCFPFSQRLCATLNLA